jgi:hypothetical protein
MSWTFFYYFSRVRIIQERVLLIVLAEVLQLSQQAQLIESCQIFLASLLLFCTHSPSTGLIDAGADADLKYCTIKQLARGPQKEKVPTYILL